MSPPFPKNVTTKGTFLVGVSKKDRGVWIKTSDLFWHIRRLRVEGWKITIKQNYAVLEYMNHYYAELGGTRSEALNKVYSTYCRESGYGYTFLYSDVNILMLISTAELIPSI